LEYWKRNLPLHPMTSYRGMIDYYIANGDLETAGDIVKVMEKVGPTD
jgi:pentatricopeptide repeat protein